MTNINKTTGIPFGFIAATALDSELVDTLLYEAGTDHSQIEAIYNAALENFTEKHEELNTLEIGAIYDYVEEHFENEKNYEKFFEEVNNLSIEEPTITGAYEGVEYATSYFGGALHFFILSSPVTTEKARKASPCVPNAGILDTLDGEEYSYNVPTNWRRDDD